MRRSHPLLARGETVGVVATGFAVRRAALRAGIARLEGEGYRVREGQALLERDGYLAGDDDARVADLNAMLADPDVRAIWFARGGYGTGRILDRIAWRRLARHPRLLIGYSDLTALFAAAVDRAGQTCLYGPVVTELAERRAYDRSSLRELLAGNPISLKFPAARVLVHGRAQGRLAGGNLTVLTHLCGTRFMPDLRGAVLFLEDVGEPTYRLDRCLTQLRTSGALRHLSAVLLGHFAVPVRRRFPPDRSLETLFREFFADLGIPVVRGLPVGHRPLKRSLPIGGRVELDTRRGLVRFEP